MKIKTRPHQYAPQQTIVIKEKRGGEGCFLQTLNCGCGIVFVIVLAIILGIAYKMVRKAANGDFNTIQKPTPAAAAAQPVTPTPGAATR